METQKLMYRNVIWKLVLHCQGESMCPQHKCFLGEMFSRFFLHITLSLPPANFLPIL